MDMKKTIITIPRVAIVGFVIIIFAIGYHAFLEDAYMHLRYCENSYAAGHWSVWNLDDPPVPGESSPLWLLLLLILKYVGVGPYFASKVIGALCLLGLYLQLYEMYLQRRVSEGYPSHHLFFLLQLFLIFPAIYYAVSGMETILFVFLVVALLNSRSLTWFWILSVLTVLVRPEGCMFVFLAAVIKFKSLRGILVAGLPSFILFSAGLLVHYYYFGLIFPTTYYAKHHLPWSHALYRGGRYVWEFFSAYYVHCILAVIYFFTTKRDDADNAAIAYIIMLSVYILLIGGDSAAFPYYRFLMPGLVCLVLFSFLSIERFSHSTPTPILTLCLLLVASNLPLFLSEVRKDRQVFKRWMVSSLQLESGQCENASMQNPVSNLDILGRVSPSTQLYMATSRCGELPVRFLWLNFIDILGLHDKHIALHGKRYHFAGDGKTDPDYVLSRKPHFIELTISPGRKLLDWNGGDSCTDDLPHDEGIFNSSSFRLNYLLLPTDDRALFIRKDAQTLLPYELRQKCAEIFKTVERDGHGSSKHENVDRRIRPVKREG
jgi:hypothetical protein